MAVELFIEQPIGHRTEDRQFRPGDQVRIAGRITMWGLWPGPVGVSIRIYDQREEDWASVDTSTNFVGNFWWDVALPTPPGYYVVRAYTNVLGSAALPLEITAAAVHLSFELGVDPAQPVLGGEVKLTARALADGLPISGAVVYFSLYPPQEGLPPVVRAGTTDSAGVAWAGFNIDYIGEYLATAQAPVLDTYEAKRFTAVIPEDAAHPPTPTPEPPTIAPQPTPSLDLSGMLSGVMVLMLLGSLMSMMGGLTGKE